MHEVKSRKGRELLLLRQRLYLVGRWPGPGGRPREGTGFPLPRSLAGQPDIVAMEAILRNERGDIDDMCLQLRNSKGAGKEVTGAGGLDSEWPPRVHRPGLAEGNGGLGRVHHTECFDQIQNETEREGGGPRKEGRGGLGVVGAARLASQVTGLFY